MQVKKEQLVAEIFKICYILITSYIVFVSFATMNSSTIQDMISAICPYDPTVDRKRLTIKLKSQDFDHKEEESWINVLGVRIIKFH